jgi:hypothetical protein
VVCSRAAAPAAAAGNAACIHALSFGASSAAAGACYAAWRSLPLAAHGTTSGAPPLLCIHALYQL